MERFYYRVLPRQGLIVGAVAYVGDRAVGFIAATHDSAGFMRSALRRSWMSFGWILGTSVVLAPKSIRSVWEAGRAIRARGSADSGQPEGEILSFGVLPGYQDLRDEASGLRISAHLLDYAVTRLEASGVGVIRAMVKADNTPAKLFYGALGWTLRRAKAQEWRSPTVEFVWRHGSEAGADRAVRSSR